MDDKTPRTPFVLRKLSLPARLTIAVFLISVGVGYISALVQLHFQHAGPGKLLPEPEDAKIVFHGKSDVSQMERLLTDAEHKPFNGQGSMRAAFTKKSAGWDRDIKKRAAKNGGDMVKADKELRDERLGEIAALLLFIRGKCKEEEWGMGMQLPADFKHPIAEKFVDDRGDKKFVKVAEIVDVRCTRCHTAGAAGAGQFPIDSLDEFREYCQIFNGGGMSIEKLAQSSHVHLLGFAMLYGLTGILFSLTNYPWLVRLVIAPLPLLAQVVDISFWWLARIDPIFAQGIVFSGGIVALGLMLHIILTLLHLFGILGRVILVLIAGAIGAAFYWKLFPYVQQHLDRNRAVVAVSLVAPLQSPERT